MILKIFISCCNSAKWRVFVQLVKDIPYSTINVIVDPGLMLIN